MSLYIESVLPHLVFVEVSGDADPLPLGDHLPGHGAPYLLDQGEVGRELLLPEHLEYLVDVRFQDTLSAVEERQVGLAGCGIVGGGHEAYGSVLAGEGVVGVGPGPFGQEDAGEEFGEVTIEPDALHEVAPPHLPYPCAGDHLPYEKAAGPALFGMEVFERDEVGLEHELSRTVGGRGVVGSLFHQGVVVRVVREVDPEEVEVEGFPHAVETEEGGPQDARRIEEVGEAVEETRADAYELPDHREKVPEVLP